jgi:hypothetical protein
VETAKDAAVSSVSEILQAIVFLLLQAVRKATVLPIAKGSGLSPGATCRAALKLVDAVREVCEIAHT